MKFKLDPPSGHAESYLDVRFLAEFEKADRAEIRIFNDSVKQPLEILAVTYGFITNETTAVIKNSSSIEGFINIFNRDKMNKGFTTYTSVDIRSEMTLYRGDTKEVVENITTFYNESKSLDSEVIPFDVHVNNSEIHLGQNEPLKLSLVCDSDKQFELSVRHDLGNQVCVFEVYAKKGRTDVSLPCEVLFADLGLKELGKNRRTFDLCWTKFEGLDYSKVMNRKNIKIPNISITLVGERMMPQPQGRLGPLEPLSEDFVLSDRYFVHTHKDFSGFGAKLFNTIKMKRLTFFMHEAQDMTDFDRSEFVTPVGNILAQEKLRPAYQINALGVSKQKKFLENFSPVFRKQTKAPSIDVQEQQTAKAGGCAGCGRKRK